MPNGDTYLEVQAIQPSLCSNAPVQDLDNVLGALFPPQIKHGQNFSRDFHLVIVLGRKARVVVPGIPSVFVSVEIALFDHHAVDDAAGVGELRVH